MPDGQLLLLALPPECCQGEGPEAVQYLKLFCRYITDRKVGVKSLSSTPADVCEVHIIASLLSLSGRGFRHPAGDL